MSSVWLTMATAGLLTFLTRFSFIAVSGRWSPSSRFRRALEFVPVAVLSAIISSEIFVKGGSFVLSPANPRLIASIVAILVAYRSRSTLLTIAAGMVVYWITSALLPRIS